MFKVLLSGKQREHACGVSANALLELGHDFTGICRVLNSSGIDGTISTHRFGEFNHSLAERFNLSTKIGQVLLSGKELYNTKSVSILNQTLLELGHNLSCVGGISNCVGVNGAIGTYRLGKLYNCLSELLKLLSESTHVLGALEHLEKSTRTLHSILHFGKGFSCIRSSGYGFTIKITSGKNCGKRGNCSAKFDDVYRKFVHRISSPKELSETLKNIGSGDHCQHLNERLYAIESIGTKNLHSQNKRLNIHPELTNRHANTRKSAHCSGSKASNKATNQASESVSNRLHNRSSLVDRIGKSTVKKTVKCSNCGKQCAKTDNNCGKSAKSRDCHRCKRTDCRKSSKNRGHSQKHNRHRNRSLNARSDIQCCKSSHNKCKSSNNASQNAHGSHRRKRNFTNCSHYSQSSTHSNHENRDRRSCCDGAFHVHSANKCNNASKNNNYRQSSYHSAVRLTSKLG